MAKSFTKLENFLSEIRSQYTPRSDRFEVVFNMPRALINRVNARQLSLYCEEAQIPGLSATNLPVKIGAWTEYRTQNVEFLTTEMAFTFIIDEKWRVREAFEEWIALAGNPNSKEVGYYEDYVSTIDIKSLSVDNDVLAEWRLIDATPKLINLTPVSWGNSGILRMSVSFSAKYWYKRDAAQENAAAEASRLAADEAAGIQQSGIRRFVPPNR
jgi:hypothetical protein